MSKVSGDFGINNKTPLEDIVSYGILDFVSGMIKPIAQFMLKRCAINQFTNNFGWSIVILTVALNMLSSLSVEKFHHHEARRRRLE